MAFNYVTSSLNHLSITECVSAYFSSTKQLNLITVQNNELKVYITTQSGLELLKSVKINGRILLLKTVRPVGKDAKDLVFIITLKLDILLLGCTGNGDQMDVSVKMSGSVKDRLTYSQMSKGLVTVDPTCKYIAMCLVSGSLIVIPIEGLSGEYKPHKILYFHYFEDFSFLYGCATPTLALLIRRSGGSTHVLAKASIFDCLQNQDEPGQLSGYAPRGVIVWEKDNIEAEAFKLIPVLEPYGGAMIFGIQSVVYCNENTRITVPLPNHQNNLKISGFTSLAGDGSRYLVGYGSSLLLLTLEKDENASSGTCSTVRDIRIELLLGRVSIPECLACLDNGFLFNGSHYGDSQLLKLNWKLEMNRPNVTIVETFISCAPITSLALADVNQQSQMLVTCSGARINGSLRVLRKDFGFQEHASIELPGVEGIWTLKLASDGSNLLDDALVLSTFGHTRVLSLNGEVMEDAEIPGLITDQQTFFCGNASQNNLLQVTTSSVRLISLETKQMISEWVSPIEKLYVVTCHKNQVLCAAGRDLFYLEIDGNVVTLKGHKTFEHEVACIDSTPLHSDAMRADMCAVGLWTDISIRLLKLPSLVEYHKESFGGDFIPRSILMACIGEVPYLFVALGDGSLFYSTMDPITKLPSDRKKAMIGSGPASLRLFRWRETDNIFVSSDKPSVIFSSSTNKLTFAPIFVNGKTGVNHACPLNASLYPNSLILTSDSGIIITTLEASPQNLHIHSVPLEESPRRIAYQEDGEIFAVITCQDDNQNHHSASTRAPSTSTSSSLGSVYNATKRADDPDTDDIDIYNLLIVDKNSFEVLHAHQFHHREYALCILSTRLGDDPTPYLVVGTAIVHKEEIHPSSGRIVVLKWTEGKLSLVFERSIKGACYSMASFSTSNKLAVTINNSLVLFEWIPTDEKKLKVELQHQIYGVSIYVKCRGDYIVVGDMMFSLTLLHYIKGEQGSRFEKMSSPRVRHNTSAVEFLDDGIVLASDSHFNLNVHLNQPEENPPWHHGDEIKMQEICNYYLGEIVNVFHVSSLANDSDPSPEFLAATSRERIIFATVDGCIGVITKLSKELYEMLHELQNRMVHIAKPVCGIEHSFYRSSSNDDKLEPSKGFIDGDLIKIFLDLPAEVMEQTAEGLQVTIPV